ncbi:hypothetical protein [Williamsia sp.]|uniref:hypothetical protein n=1 Tax=Williamsia sp. TaxID=1872085 RepID=UPI001A35E6CB|nr:hypothetical protein [Williamsia sp.]MBJ7290268.1 hypothetical protein [Williamsia sp.]
MVADARDERLGEVGSHIGTVSPLEVRVFAAMWGQDWMPYPLLDFPGKTSTSTLDAERRAIEDRFRSDPPREFEEWARTSVAPDIRVEAVVTDPREEHNARRESLRLNAVRRRDFGYLSVQTAIEDGRASGGIDVYALPAVELGRALVAALPIARSSSLGDITVPTTGDNTDGDDEVVVTVRDTPIDVDQRSAKLAADPIVSAGFIQVRQGWNSERRLEPGVPRLMWSDHENYGRYVMASGVDAAVDDGRMRTYVDQLIGRVVAMVREERGS